jgi:hypothetical protein
MYVYGAEPPVTEISINPEPPHVIALVTEPERLNVLVGFNTAIKVSEQPVLLSVTVTV